MHIWHHAHDMPESHKNGVNFGITLSIWDYLFKTDYIPYEGRDIKLGFPGIEEFPKDFNYSTTSNRCHSSIGKAIYYTSVTITVGFSILTLSDFIPTIYFGLLIGVAMVAALINNLTLLPILIITFKPLGPGKGFRET